MSESDRIVDRARHVDHVIALWPMRYRRGWCQAACSCGEHVESRIDGVVEVWATWHGMAVGETTPLVDFRCQ